MSVSAFLTIVVTAGLASACASTGAVPHPFPVPASPPAVAAAPEASPGPSTASSEGQAITETALALRGAPYRDGGADPDRGFDCSGFTQFVFSRHGVRLPRSVHDQFAVGKNVKASALQPGDLLFFSTVGSGATHVGIALGGGEFIHAPSSNGVVRVEHLSTRYWSERFIGARRMELGTRD